MSNKSLPPALAALMASFASGDVDFEVTTVEVRKGESIEEAVARTHRESCEDCAAEHEAAMKAEHATGANDREAELVAKERLAKQHASERENLDKQHKAQWKRLDEELNARPVTDDRTARQEGMRPEMAMPYGAGENQATPRKPIGYMVFHIHPDGTAKAVPPSFDESRKVVEEAMAEVNAHPIAMLMSGLSGTRTEIRPVFGE